MPAFQKFLEEIKLLPGVEVGVVLTGGIPVVGTLVAQIESRKHDCPPFVVPAPVVNVDADLEPEFLVIQLTVAAVFGALTFPIGTLVAINTINIQLIGPSPI
ncbi:MAG TPA: hypothetical protein PKA10_13305 [Selenomonadales bacterium]|nr:hypothetical protein [Selenomonadales bacterium]